MTSPSQLVLDLSASSPSLDNFVAGPNRECLAVVRALVAGDAAAPIVYLWGAAGSGKSHLARALIDATAKADRDAATSAGGTADPDASLDERNPAGTADSPSPRLLGPDSPLTAFEQAGHAPAALAVDDCHLLDAERQHALFALINRVRATPGARLLATGISPPLALTLREDLRTRLGWGLVLALAPLADADKALALQALAGERGVMMSAEVVPYLLTHTSRDMRQLIGLFDALDRLALQRQRAITIPLVRELLQTSMNTE